MLSRYSPSRCCCAAPQPDDPCPCLDGTLGGSKQSHVSGITWNENTFRFADINGSHDLETVVICNLEFDEVVNINATAQTFIQFTRQDVWNVVADGIVGQTFALPSGVKAVFSIYASSLMALFGFGLSIASFYKVLTDVNGFVDCSLGLTGFTFIGQSDHFIPTLSGPIAGFEDASAAIVSYS